MPKSHWRAERVDDPDGATVFVHPELSDVRIQQGPHVDRKGDVWAGGVQVVVLVDGEWTAVEDGSFFWVHEAQAWAEDEMLP